MNIEKSFKTNIDLKTLEALVQYAKEFGGGELKTVTITHVPSGLGCATVVSATWDGKQTDVTNYEAW